jgi:O-antigen ligase
MVFGLILSIPNLSKKYAGAYIRVPFDYFILSILFLVILLSYLTNYSTSNWNNLQAYILMFATYIYVKENTILITLDFLDSLVKYFLLINGVLVIMQLLTGDYFPARFMAAGDPPLIIASGVSDGPTKNGMLISFALSYLFARLIFKKFPFSLFDFSIFLVGFISLLLATSRAGILSFFTVIIFGCLFALVQTTKKSQYKLRSSFIIGIAGFISAVWAFILQNQLNFEIFYHLRDGGKDNYALDALFYKLSVFIDGSMEERFDIYEFGMNQFLVSPVHFFLVGFGPGTFEKLNGENVHNSYFDFLFATGSLGFLLLLLLVGHVIRKALSRPDTLEIIPLLFALGSIMVFMLAHDVMTGRVFWVALGVISAFAYSNPTSRETISV